MKLKLLFILSIVIGLVHAQPSISFPPNNAVDVRVKTMVQWSYDVVNLNEFQLDTSLQFNSPMFQTGSSVLGAGDFNTLRFNTKYFLRARTILKSTGDTSKWSTVYNFRTLDTFEVTSPFMNATGQNISLGISFKSSGSMSRLWLDTTPTFNSPVLRDILVPDSAFLVPANPNITSVYPDNLFFNKKYYIRGMVYAPNDTTPLSKTFTFTTKAGPTIASPYNTQPNVASNVVVTYTYVSGTSIDSNVSYTVQIDTSKLFNSSLFYSFTKIGNMGTPNAILKYNKKYNIRIRAAHKFDTSAWSTITTFTTVVNPGGFTYPYLVSPDTLLNIDSVIFQTASFSEVKRYDFMFDTSTLFNSPILISDTMKLSTYGYGTRTVKNLYFNKNYYVAVRMISSVDTSTWYIKRYSTIAWPKLLQPGFNSTYTITNPILTWSVLKSMKGYILQLDTSNTFNSPILQTFDSTFNTDKMVTPDLGYDQVYYWRLKIKTAIDTSAWSATWNFKTSPFATYINSPLQDAQNVSINPTSFSWDQPAGGRGYHYQISTDSTFATGINGYILDPTVTYLNYNGLHYSTKYFFRVRVYNHADSADWYYLRRFFTLPEPPTPGVPTLVSPANNAIKQMYLNLPLSWNASVNSLSYDLEIATNPQFINSTIANTSNLSLAFTQLSPGTDYYWHVRGVNGAKTSAWSNTFTFLTMDALYPPVNLSPDNFETKSPVTVVLSWSQDVQATKYEFQYGNDPYFSGAATYSSTTNQATIHNLTGNLTYYWRVRTISGNLMTSWSQIAIFRTTLTGMNELNNDQEGIVYPNPTQGLLYFKKGNVHDIQSIEVYDVRAQQVLEFTGHPSTLNLSHLPKGLYLLQVRTGKGVFQQRIILE